MNQTLLIAILSPILITIGGIVSWILKSKKEEVLNAESKSREFKIETYKKLLEPFIATLTFTLPEKIKHKEINDSVNNWRFLLKRTPRIFVQKIIEIITRLFSKKKGFPKVYFF